MDDINKDNSSDSPLKSYSNEKPASGHQRPDQMGDQEFLKQMIQNRSKMNSDRFSFGDNIKEEFSIVKRNRTNSASARKLQKTNKQNSLQIEIDDF